MKKIIVLLLIAFAITACFETRDPEQIHKTEATFDVITLNEGDTFELSAEEIMHEIKTGLYPMYGYNGKIPGPVLKVKQGSKVTINFENNIDMDTTIHWHGLRHANKDDGVPDVTQEPVKPGERFSYELHFPDPGMYWYHPHIREDKQQDLGLYGLMLVEPSDTNYWNEVNKEELIVLDDLLIDKTGIVPHGAEHANFALMGRFGNTLLVNGHTQYHLEVNRGDIVRFYITNTANVRPFKLSFGGFDIKLVGSDLGRVETEQLYKEIMISPAERHIIEVLFDTPGVYDLMHTNPEKSYKLGEINVLEEKTAKQLDFSTLRNNNDITPEFSQYLDQPVDFDFELTVDVKRMDMMMEDGMMHGKVPCHRMPDGTMMGDCEEHTEEIEWEDPMPEMNARMTTEDVKWIIRNRKTGKENMDMDLNAKIGDKKKIRLFNNPDSAHPMQHPIHLHGQRFLVTHVDGEPVKHLEWKETITITVGETVDVLVDFTNPGEWLMHCHIPEHMESGMMISFMVKE